VVGKLIIPDKSGHSVVAYDTEAPETVIEAERLFREALDRGGAAFKIDKVGGDVRITDWDPTAAEVIVIQPLIGG
jgi:hypothetical protein